MREHEVCDGFLMVLLVDRRGNNERVEGSELQIGCERCAIKQLDLVPALANMRCRPCGNFPRLPFGRSIDNQDVHDILRRRAQVRFRADWAPATIAFLLDPGLTAGETHDNRPVRSY